MPFNRPILLIKRLIMLQNYSNVATKSVIKLKLI